MENTLNPNSQMTSKRTSLLWSVVLLILSVGLWGIYLVFHWTKNLNYLNRSEKFNPWIPAVISAVGYLLGIISAFAQGSWIVDLLALLLSVGVDLFLIVQIKSVCDRQNQENGTWKNVFGWMVTTWVLDTARDLFTLGHHDCKCVLCSGTTFVIALIVSTASFCLLAWLFNHALEHEKNTSNLAVNEGTSNGAWIFGIISVLVTVILIICSGVIGALQESAGETVAEFREAAEQEINKALSDSSHNLRRYVENAHKTVTVHTAFVSDLRIITKDGSTNAGVEGNNIRRINLEITTRWDGIIHKNGYTVIGIEIENINGEGKVTSAGIIRTNATVNTEDPNFWYEVGAAAALLLL